MNCSTVTTSVSHFRLLKLFFSLLLYILLLFPVARISSGHKHKQRQVQTHATDKKKKNGPVGFGHNAPGNSRTATENGQSGKVSTCTADSGGAGGHTITHTAKEKRKKKKGGQCPVSKQGPVFQLSPFRKMCSNQKVTITIFDNVTYYG